MTFVPRILVGALGAFVAAHQAYAIYGDLTGPYDKAWFIYPFNGVFITLGLLALWFALAGPKDLNRVGRALIVGLIAGAVGLVAGIGYAVIVPLASGRSPGNLFPIIGIFTTGPAGFVLGCLGALAYQLALGRPDGRHS